MSSSSTSVGSTPKWKARTCEGRTSARMEKEISILLIDVSTDSGKLKSKMGGLMSGKS
jgi:hypothetical protein